MTHVQSLKEKVVQAGIRLVESGLIARTWGNVSCRVDDAHFAITASGRDYLTMTPDEIVIVNIFDLSYTGDVKPSGEKAVHAEIYKQRPECQFVIHTHQENASIIGTLGLDSLELFEMNPFLGSKVICADYGLPGTKRLSRAISEALKQSDGCAIIMKNHGAVCFGTDDAFAFQVASELEAWSKTYLEALLKSQGQILDVVENQDKDLTLVQTIIQSQLTNVPYVLYSTECFTRACSTLNQPLKPYVDDFAQIVGTKVLTVSDQPDEVVKALKKASAVLIKGFGAVCIGANEGDARAVKMILEKNAKAHICGMNTGDSRALGWIDTHLMRAVYLKKYARQIDTHPSKNGGQS